MWLLHLYLTINAIAFVFIYCKIMFTTKYSMFIYPDLIEWLENDRNLSRIDAIIYAVLSTIVFGPAFVAWYLSTFIPLGIVALGYGIILLFSKKKKK